MILNNARDEKQLREASEISTNILRRLGEEIKAGTTPLAIDRLAGFLCKEYNVQPAFKRVEGYNYNTCISINDVAVHGIPDERPLQIGDLVSIDFGIIKKNMYTDHCWTWSLDKPSRENEKLLKAGREAVENCIPLAIVGNHTGDLGYEMERVAKGNGFNVMRMFVGHGIGKSLHDSPDVPAFGKRGKGTLLVDGMTICIECQVVDDSGDVVIDNDGWSARTRNGGNSVMFEYMVIVRKDNPDILTDTLSWDTVIL
jgi:methionyl aminopeptidase